MSIDLPILAPCTESVMGARARDARIQRLDNYDFSPGLLEKCKGILISDSTDQAFLSRYRGQITSFVRNGGRVLINGHIENIFLEGLSNYCAIPNYTLQDLQVKRLIEHPWWNETNTERLTYTRGVAGFYGRGGHTPPSNAVVIHTVGEYEPFALDYFYSLGKGEVFVHAGNDIIAFIGQGTPCAKLVFDWLSGEASNGI